MAALIKALLQPVAIVWLGLLALCVWQIYKSHYRWAAVPGALFLFVFITGSSPLAGYLIAGLEAPYARTNWDDLPEADTVVVLGGFVGGSNYEINGLNFNKSADRILTGIELIRRNKSDALVVGGGSFESEGKEYSEASQVKPWMAEWEVLGDAKVDDLGICNNTREEAVKFARLAKEHDWSTIILVTSANHMKRAGAVFQSEGIEVVPVACDFKGIGKPNSWKLIPDQDRMIDLRTWLYEKVGWAYYRSKGWIRLEALPKE